MEADLVRLDGADEAHDSEFPDHPLSRIRAELRTIESTCRIEPAVRALQAIRP